MEQRVDFIYQTEVREKKKSSIFRLWKHVNWSVRKDESIYF